MKLYPNQCYHIYNHANGNENLFYSKENYDFFLTKVEHFVVPFANVYAYCLMPNHFHMLVKIKSHFEIIDSILLNRSIDLLMSFDLKKKDHLKNNLLRPELFVSKQFSNVFNAYAQSLNLYLERKGNLFRKSYKAKLVGDDEYLRNILVYIHRNPVHHNFSSNLIDWQWSSYLYYLNMFQNGKNDIETMKLFSGIEDFYNSHL